MLNFKRLGYMLFPRMELKDGKYMQNMGHKFQAKTTVGRACTRRNTKKKHRPTCHNVLILEAFCISTSFTFQKIKFNLQSDPTHAQGLLQEKSQGICIPHLCIPRTQMTHILNGRSTRQKRGQLGSSYICI